MKLMVRISMALVAVAAAALSFQSLWRLGQLTGYGNLAWAFPLVVDLSAASSCAAWLDTKSRQAWGMTWAPLATSVLLNGTSHYLDSTGTSPAWLLVVAVAAVPPTVLGLCVHLAVSLGAESAPTRRWELSISTYRARGLLADISNGGRNLGRGAPLFSLLASLLIAAGLYTGWVRAGRPRGIATIPAHTKP